MQLPGNQCAVPGAGRRWPAWIGPLLIVCLLAGAGWAVHGQLKGYHYADISAALRSIPAWRILAAIGLTVVNYLALAGYDFLATRYMGRPVHLGRVLLAALAGNAFSNAIGLSAVAGSSVRFRLYTAWGFAALEVAKVVIFTNLTLWLGLLTVGGGVFLLAPPGYLPPWLHLPFGSTRVMGALLLAVPALYLAGSLVRRRPFCVRGMEFSLPSPAIAASQVAVSAIDWVMASGVLYVLLPAGSDVSLPLFLSVFLPGQLLGLVSQVPGGLGVFESVVLFLLGTRVPASALVASLLAYRLVYYFLPLLAASVLLGIREALAAREQVGRAAKVAGRWASALAPRFFALAVFASGAVLLFSGATPAVGWRIEVLRDVLPLSVIESSHFLASLAGVCLLILARGLQARLDAAWWLTVGALCLGVLASLLKGLDYEEAVLMAVMLGALIPSHREFYRHAALLSEPFTPSWAMAVAVVIAGSAWLGLFSYRHLDLDSDVWWRFAFSGHASRSLRAAVGVTGAAVVFAAAHLLRPARPHLEYPDRPTLDRLAPLVASSRDTNANLAFLGDKRLLLSDSGRSFLMYAVEGRSWVAMGDPIGPEDEAAELAWSFRELSDRYGGWTVFYEVGPKYLPLYIDLGLTLLKLGEEGRVDLAGFGLEGGHGKGFRRVLHQLDKDGCEFAIVGPDQVPALLPELQLVSDAWLAHKRTREKGFSLGFFDPDYLARLPMALVRRSGRVLAFANLWLGADWEELSVDLLRYGPDAPPSVSEYLALKLMLWGREQGYRWYNLGMAPMSGLQAGYAHSPEDHALAPLWNRFGAFLYSHGGQFYNFQGLRQYKDKFDPVWQPRYLACPGSFAVPRVLANVASLVSGGMRGVVAK